MLKLPHYCTLSHTSKVMLKILQARLQQYVNHEVPDVQAGFRKGRGTRDQIVNIHWIMEKAREFQKNIYFCFIDYAKAFDGVDHNKLWKILREKGAARRTGKSTEVSASIRQNMCVRKWLEAEGRIEKAREFQKNIYFCFIDYAKAFDYVDHNKLWKIL